MKRFIEILLCLLWTQISFSQQNFWQITNAPTSLKVVSIDTKSVGYVFIAAEDSGVYRSTNGGQEWSQTNNGINYIFMLSIKVALNGDIFSGSLGVYSSTNNGESWNQSGTLNAAVFCFLFKPNGFILVGTGGGIYRPTDDGSTWIPVNNGLPSPSGIDIHTLVSNSAGDIFAGSSFYGIFRSTDNGDNWTEINNGLPLNPDVRTILINYSDHLFAGIGTEGVYCSTDNGNNWFSSGILGARVSSLIIDSNGKIFAGTYGDGVFITADNGVNWDQINSGLTNMDVRCLTVDANDFVYVGTDRGGVFKSIDSTTEVLNPNDIFIPSDFSLNQNYPNPFNPSTKISWQVPVGSWQTLKIYDLLGNEVTTLIDEYKPAGKYEIVWDASYLPSGVYFYQLNTENFIETKKMIIIN